MAQIMRNPTEDTYSTKLLSPNQFDTTLKIINQQILVQAFLNANRNS